MRRSKAALDYALHLSRANGKSASVGYDTGGTFSFRFAAEAPQLNAAVVFYGMPPEQAAMAKSRLQFWRFMRSGPEFASTVERQRRR